MIVKELHIDYNVLAAVLKRIRVSQNILQLFVVRNCKRAK